MKTNHTYNRIPEAVLLAALCAVLAAGVWAQGRAGRLAEDLVRLHVVAVSDDEAEQAVKLRVRDAVLAYLEPSLDGLHDAQTARGTIRTHLDGIQAAAETAAEGHPVTVTLGREYYPTRDYGSFALPAGEYCSLRVVLGEGQGHNWWCVVFPPLCMSAAESPAAEAVGSGLTDADASLISGQDGDYVIRFRALELWGELQHRLEQDHNA